MRSGVRRRKEVRPSLKEIADRAAAEAERQAICLALHGTRGNKSEAARLLRVDYTTLHLKMKQYGLPLGRSGSCRRRDSLVTLVCSAGYLRRTSITLAGARPLPLVHS